jgi:tRNA threonylcarbamoyl adenosine modification protein YeaZ
MKILALELSTEHGSLAFLDSKERPTRTSAAAREDACAPQNKDVDLLVREWPNDRKNSGPFFQNLKFASEEFGSPDKIIVGLGPGSYAGVRIAISAAIGLQASSTARLIGLPSICAIGSAEYCVIGDARRQSFFFARIRANELIEGPSLFGEDELKSKLDTLGSDVPIFSSESLPQFPRAVIRYPSAQLLARLAQESNCSFKLPPLEPIYLREPHITMPKAANRSTVAR